MLSIGLAQREANIWAFNNWDYFVEYGLDFQKKEAVDFRLVINNQKNRLLNICIKTSIP